jgi:hypothetical protein
MTVGGKRSVTVIRTATNQNQAMRNLLRKPMTWLLLGVLIVGAVVGLWLFQPWKAFVDQTVDEALPDAAATADAPTAPTATASPSSSGSPARPVVLAEGKFVTHEHDTSGTAQLVRLPDGRHVLALKNLDTSNGPDLRVWLTDRKVTPGRDGWHIFDDGEYLGLGRLKGNKGNQVYAIPGSADLGQYRSVTIWCKRFSVSFGAAEFSGVESAP